MRICLPHRDRQWFGFTPMRALRDAVAPRSLSRARTSSNGVRNSTIFFFLKRHNLPRHSSHLAAARISSSQQLRRDKSFALRLGFPTMSDDKSRKQATLGYVRDSQMTIGCVKMLLMREAPIDSRVRRPAQNEFANSLHFPPPGDSSAPISMEIKHRRSKQLCPLAERGREQAVMRAMSLWSPLLRARRTLGS